MNAYSIPLNFELPLFNTNLSPIEYLKSLPIWANNIKTNPGLAKHFKLNWQTQLSGQLNQFFLDHGQKITWCEIFYKEPNIVSKIQHISMKENENTQEKKVQLMKTYSYLKEERKNIDELLKSYFSVNQNLTNNTIQVKQSDSIYNLLFFFLRIFIRGIIKKR